MYKLVDMKLEQNSYLYKINGMHTNYNTCLNDKTVYEFELLQLRVDAQANYLIIQDYIVRNGEK